MIHLIKLAVGIRDVAHMEAVQHARAEAHGDLAARRVYTRNKPIRPDAGDGSLYWVIQGIIRCRQRVRGFEAERDDEGRRYCLIVLDPEIVLVAPTQRAAFQGWRYLEPAAAPADISTPAGAEPPPDEMIAELRRLGLI